MNKVLPEGTVAGLKGANSSVGGCRPCEGSRVLAGEAGVCAGCDRRSDRGKTREKHIIGNTVKDFVTSHELCMYGSYSPMER